MRDPPDPSGESPPGSDENQAFPLLMGQGVVTFAGGSIPGLTGVPAFAVAMREPAPLPIVLASPHGGRAYPQGLLDAMRAPTDVLRLEDRLVDRLAIEVARRTGASLIVANAPRAMIDLNRAVDDIDWDMVAPGTAGQGETRHAHGRLVHPGHVPRGNLHQRRARGGLGLVPRRLPGSGDLWKGRIAQAEIAARLAEVHEPYHAALSAMLARVRERWGAVLLIDVHSMPPLPIPPSGEPAPSFVVGDRFGAACDGTLVASAFGFFAARRAVASHNRPYAGGHVLERHSRRAEGINGLQLEIDRQCYLDRALVEPGPGFETTIELIAALVRHVAADVAAIGRERLSWRAAAE